MPSAKRPVLDAVQLRQRLVGLRHRLRAVAIVRGVGLLLLVALASALVAGLLDWSWHLPALVRAVVLTGTLAGGVFVAYRYLFRPLKVPNDDLSLALRVEEAYPGLNDALASTVQFLERGSPSDASSAVLEREAVKRALGRATGCDFGKVVNKRGVVWAGFGGGAALALCIAMGIWFPILAWTAFVRLADPFGFHDWPKQTRLEIDDPRTRIGRNESFEVRGRVLGVVPRQATIIFRFEGFPNLEHVCDIKTDETGAGRLLTRLEPGRVQRNFRFQVKANDALSEEYRVEVLPPPSLSALDDKPSPQVQLRFPGYTGLPSPETLSPGMGNIDAVVGTTARLRARVDRPLKRAWIEYQPEQPTASLGDILTLWNGGRPWWEPVPAVIEEDRCTFAVDFTPTTNGTYSLHFEDETDLTNSRLFELRLHTDPAPTVNLERPSPSHDILSVLPNAVLPLEVAADDPTFAVRSVFLEYRTKRDEAPRRLYLYDPAHGAAPLLAPWAGPSILASSTLATRPQRLDFRQKLRIESLRHADGRPLKEEDVLLLRACADDFDDVNPNKAIGSSHEIEIRIVGRNGLEIVLNQEQANVQQELLRLREKEREALKKATEAESRLRKGEKLNAEDQEKLLQAEQLQQQIRERVGTDKEGLRAELKRILETLKNNRLEKSATQERMKDVAREIDRLAENQLQQIEPRLTNARKLAEQMDEKTAQDRKAQLEARAKEVEREAKAAEESANKHEREAEQAERKAEQSSSEAETARQKREAKQRRERAEEMRQKSREMRDLASRARQEAEQKPDPDQPRKELAEARKNQEEVEKTLNDLLTRRLEPWTSSHEIKGEANRLLDEQKRAQAEVEKMIQRQDKSEETGKSREQLTKEQKAELDTLADTQRKLEERTRHLLDKMDRVAQQRQEKDPETARELRDAHDQAQQDNLGEKMKEAREQIDRNELNKARDSQKENVRSLGKLVKNLEDRREAELDRLTKKLREKEKELGELIKEQEELRKKVKEAGKIGDKAERQEELKRLARQQRDLQKKTDDMVQQLTRLRAGRASQSLSRAGEEMQGAGQQMNEGKSGEDEQDETLERLNEASQELQRARKEAEEELGREQISRLADLIRPLKERQEALQADTTRFQEEIQQKGKWTRALQLDFANKGEAQKNLGQETTELVEKQLTKAAVFARLMRRAGEAMTEAGERMRTLAQQSADPAQLPDTEALRAQKLALRRLTQVVDALKDAAEQMQQQANSGGGGGGGGEGGENGGASGAPSDGIPPVAQLKLLRDLQKDINHRTDTFRKEHPNVRALEEKDKTELELIRKDQQDVAELIDELTRPAGEPGGAEGDKK